EVGGEEGAKIAGVRVREEKALREHAARRVDRNVDAGPLEPRECRRDVRVDLADERARLVAALPDPPLERLQRGRLPIAVHQPEKIRKRIARFDGRRAVPPLSSPLLCKEREIPLDLRLVPMRREIRSRALP